MRKVHFQETTTHQMLSRQQGTADLFNNDADIAIRLTSRRKESIPTDLLISSQQKTKKIVLHTTFG